MRLINTKTGLIEEFLGDGIPRYAILSHTWEKDEISLQELLCVQDPELANDPKTLAVKAKAGFVKIWRFVELAASKGIPYAWADTCLIDKTSSADLTESINSMYRWYGNSELCITYLVDVVSSVWTGDDSDPGVAGSRWFTRGWTLQELLAPRNVQFYNHSWKFLGSKRDHTHHIEDITGIHHKILEDNVISSTNVAQKMSWASNRTTTRKEDMAYCLMGLFDVNMALIYGEGEKAFLRLQEQIAATSTDHSLFAWGVPSGHDNDTENLRSYQGLFARSPADFDGCGTLWNATIVPPNEWTQTNRGFHAALPTIPSALAESLFDESDGHRAKIDDEDYLAILNCSSGSSGLSGLTGVVGIWISLIDRRDDGQNGFCRVGYSTARVRQEAVLGLLGSSPDRFRKDLWFPSTRTIQLPRNYFSNRLSGFVIPRNESWKHGASVQIHYLYSDRVSEPNIVSCPLLPLQARGGLVGVVVVKVPVSVDGTCYKNDVGVVFGYPPGLRKPFAKVVGSSYDHEQPLNHDLQKHAPFDARAGDAVDVDDPHYYNNRLFAIHASLSAVLYKGMACTVLDIVIDTWTTTWTPDDDDM
jgi:hypothetical protein